MKCSSPEGMDALWDANAVGDNSHYTCVYGWQTPAIPYDFWGHISCGIDEGHTPPINQPVDKKGGDKNDHV